LKFKSARNILGPRKGYCCAIFSSTIETALSDKRTFGLDLEMPTKITTYTAPHSFASKLMNSEQATLTFNMESLRHSGSKITMDYLTGVEDEQIKKILMCWSEIFL
jgi:hypothetical protein